MSQCDRLLKTSCALCSSYFYPPAWMNISLNSTFHWIHAGPVTMGDSRHHVLSHPIKKHNRRSSACHSQACLHVGQSVYSSTSCRANWSSRTYLSCFQRHCRPELVFSHSHACTHVLLACSHTHACFTSLPFHKWNIPIYWQLEAI